MTFDGIANIFFKRMCPVSICFGKTGNGYFAASNSIAGVLQCMLFCRYFEAVDILKDDW